MNDAVLNFVAKCLPKEAVAEKDILEVGSLELYGLVRRYLGEFHPRSYVGVDGREGANVDVVLNAETDLVAHFGYFVADIVVCTEMLEHTRDWKAALKEMSRVLKPGGRLVLTTRSSGYRYHPEPIDVWRFHGGEIAQWLFLCDVAVDRLEQDPSEPGIFLSGFKVPASSYYHYDGDLKGAIKAEAAPTG